MSAVVRCPECDATVNRFVNHWCPYCRNPLAARTGDESPQPSRK